jgi:SAM-dependent methyltransferase
VLTRLNSSMLFSGSKREKQNAIDSSNVEKSKTINKDSLLTKKELQKKEYWESWDSKYKIGATHWDSQRVALPFVRLLKNYKEKFPPGKLIDLGCGNGHDAAFFGQNGFDALGIDFAPEAVKNAQKLYGQWAKFRTADIFNLPKELDSKFDYVIENGCFCVIPLQRRDEYVQSVLKLLKPTGILIGIFKKLRDGFPHVPLTNSPEETFKPYFDIEPIYKSSDPTKPFVLFVFRRKTT